MIGNVIKNKYKSFKNYRNKFDTISALGLIFIDSVYDLYKILKIKFL